LRPHRAAEADKVQRHQERKQSTKGGELRSLVPGPGSWRPRRFTCGRDCALGLLQQSLIAPPQGKSARVTEYLH
jgi:hypothetical protein